MAKRKSALVATLPDQFVEMVVMTFQRLARVEGKIDRLLRQCGGGGRMATPTTHASRGSAGRRR